jgi:hypothetical protein
MGNDFDNGSEFLAALDLTKTFAEVTKVSAVTINGLWGAFSAVDNQPSAPQQREAQLASHDSTVIEDNGHQQTTKPAANANPQP